jgi:hypothetical protein
MLNLGIKLKEQTNKNIICVELSQNNNFSLDKFAPTGKALSLKDYTEEMLNDYIGKSDMQGSGRMAVDCLRAEIDDTAKLPSLLNFLSENYHFIIYEIPDKFFGDNLYEVSYFADYFHFLVIPEKENASKASSVINVLCEKDPLSRDRVKIILSYFAAEKGFLRKTSKK